jgi:N-sulfoglucosamine sulfohydrolase
MYYPMRVVQDRHYKLIWNIAWRSEYPFASDLWASSTWQSIYRNKTELYGKRKVNDYLFRPEFELYDMVSDQTEIHNLAGDKAHAVVLDSMKQKLKIFQNITEDPWIIMWNHDASHQGTGVNL